MVWGGREDCHKLSGKSDETYEQEVQYVCLADVCCHDDCLSFESGHALCRSWCSPFQFPDSYTKAN